MNNYNHILLAIDFSQNTDAVASRAIEISHRYAAKLSLIHVVEFVQIDLSSESILPQDMEIDQELLTNAEKRLQKLADSLKIEQSECFVRQGSTRHEILAFAEQHQTDLIVIGSHGRHGIQLLLGSTANAVLHGAPCDVLAVRIRD